MDAVKTTSAATSNNFSSQSHPSLPKTHGLSSTPRNITHPPTRYIPPSSPKNYAQNSNNYAPWPQNRFSPKNKSPRAPIHAYDKPFHRGHPQMQRHSPPQGESSTQSNISTTQRIPPEHCKSSQGQVAAKSDTSSQDQTSKSNDNDTNTEPESNACRVQVSGFPKYTQRQDLSRTFTKFGNVKIDSLCQRYAVLSFSSAAEAREALQMSTKVNIYGQFLTVSSHISKNKQQFPKREFPRSKEKGVIIDPKEIELSGEFNRQLESVLEAIRLSKAEVENIGTLYVHLQEALQEPWPGCVAMPFGSIVFGLGIKSSDADCYVDIPLQYRHLQPNFVNKAKRELQRYPHIFSEILSIPRANTPIVKFFHIPTETNCDVTFKTLLGVRNSKLIAFLLSTDPRLLPMTVVIKYWAKVHGFSGTGKLTNYALTLLVIFYLQQPTLGILPTIEWLQRDPTEEFVVDFWNTGFASIAPPISNDATVAELLGGFFEFYSVFNFEELIVCPYLGFPVKKEMFKDLNQLPSEFGRYKENVIQGNSMPIRFTTSMCIQDPIEQSHNVGCAISNRLALEIKAYFKFAATAYENDKPNNMCNFLKIILLQKPKVVREKNNPEYRVNLYPKIVADIINPDWKSVIREQMFTVVEKMLKLKLGKVEEKVTPNARRTKEKYTGTITRLIWKRKQFTKLYNNMKLDLQEKETRITQEILNTDKNEIKLDFQLTITYNNEPKSSMVAIKLVNGNVEAFRDFGKFFISVTQNWLINLLRPHSKKSEKTVAAKIAETITALDGDLPQKNDNIVSDVIDDITFSDDENVDVNVEFEIATKNRETVKSGKDSDVKNH